MANTVFSTGGISGSPSFAQADKFLLTFSRLPTMTFMCQQANIPGVRVNPAEQPTQGATAPIPGSKFQFSPLNVRFLLDEDLYSWTCIFDWLQGIGFPDNSDQYKNLNLQQKLLLNSKQPQYSDATLTYYNNQNIPIIAVQYNLVFPTRLSEISFDTQQAATTPMVCEAEFMYTKFTYLRYPQFS